MSNLNADDNGLLPNASNLQDIYAYIEQQRDKHETAAAILLDKYNKNWAQAILLLPIIMQGKPVGSLLKLLHLTA